MGNPGFGSNSLAPKTPPNVNHLSLSRFGTLPFDASSIQFLCFLDPLPFCPPLNRVVNHVGSVVALRGTHLLRRPEGQVQLSASTALRTYPTRTWRDFAKPC